MQNNPPAVTDTVSTHVHQNDITVTKTKHNTNKAERTKSQELRKIILQQQSTETGSRETGQLGVGGGGGGREGMCQR